MVKFSFLNQAASLRTAESVLELSGLDKITMPPGIIENLAKMNLEAKRMVSMEESKKMDIERILMNEKNFRWLLNGN